LLFMAMMQPNDVRERRGPAANGVRAASDLNGWSPSAVRKGSTLLIQLGAC
jgi:hypothetical protein